MKTRKFVSFIISFCMAIALAMTFAPHAYAASTINVTTEEELARAFGTANSASEETTIKLSNDIAVNFTAGNCTYISIASGKSAVLDLNGKTLTFTSSGSGKANGFFCNGSLRFTGNGTIDFQCSRIKDRFLYVDSTGSVVFDNGTYKFAAPDTNDLFIAGNVIVNDGTFIDTASSGNYSEVFNISGGTLKFYKGQVTTSASNKYCTYFDIGSATIGDSSTGTGPTMSSQYRCLYISYLDDFYIYGGTFKSLGKTNGSYENAVINVKGNKNVVIDNGTFEGRYVISSYCQVDTYDQNITINNGQFTYNAATDTNAGSFFYLWPSPSYRSEKITLKKGLLSQPLSETEQAYVPTGTYYGQNAEASTQTAFPYRIGGYVSSNVTVSSIAVKTCPTKIAYNAYDSVKGDGLVLTATYSDGSTKDIVYSSTSGIAFDKSKVALGDTTLKITYGGASTTQEIYVGKFDLSHATISLSQETYTYNGKAKTPAVTVTANGETVPASEGYTVTYSENVNPGKATVSLVGKGSITGSKSKTFIIKSKESHINKLTGAAKSLTVKYRKSYKATGYQIAYRKKGASTWKYATTTKLSKTVKGLKKRTYYDVKVRSYKVIAGKTYYSGYTATKNIKVR